MQSDNIDQLATALAAAQAELLPAIKDARNPHLKNLYADLASCWEAVRACLPRHGLSVVQGGCTRGGRDFIRTTLLHASGQWIAGVTPIIIGDPKGINPMQALGSATTYARRYGLAAICGLTAEDDDGQGAGHPPQQRRDPEPRPQPPAAAKGPKPAGDLLDRLTGRYLDRRRQAHGPGAFNETEAKFELWNHLATAAVDQKKLLAESIQDFDGTRTNAAVVKALHGMVGVHDGWLQAETKAYLDSKLQPQEAAK